MKDALTKAGVEPRDVQLQIAIAKFQNNGGTLDRLLELARDAYQLPGEGQSHNASNRSHRPVADARQTETGAALEKLSKDQKTDAAPVLAREPSSSQRQAAGAAWKGAAKAVLDLGWLGSAYIPGGPKFVDLRWRDLPGAIERQLGEGATHARAAIVLRMIERAGERIGVPDPERKWADDLKPAEIRAIARATEPEILKPMAAGWLRSLNQSAQATLTDGGQNAS